MQLIKTNKILGGTIFFGLIITQIIILLVSPPLIALLINAILFPYYFTSFVSTLNRKSRAHHIKYGITASLFLLTVIPLLAPIFFDKELAYLSFFGIGLGIIMWFLRKKTEIQLLIFNLISITILTLLTIGGLFSS